VPALTGVLSTPAGLGHFSQAALVVAAGFVEGLVLGAGQAWAFPLAWIVALPLSFTPAPFVDEATPLAPQVVLWGSAGLLMAHVMALITWQGARRMFPRDMSPSR
jgi:hypothetical protein